MEKATDKKMTHEDWIIAKAYRNPEVMPYLLQHIKIDFFLDKQKRQFFKDLVVYHEDVPKVDMNGKPVLDSNGQPVTETRYSPRLLTELDSASSDTQEYLIWLSSHEELSNGDINSQIKRLVTSYQIERVKIACSKGLTSIHESNVNSVISELKENLDYAESLEVEDPLVSQREAVETHNANLLNLMENDDHRVKTGIGTLDYMLGGGLIPGSLLILASGTGQGKSMLAGQIIVNMALSQKKKIGVFGLEMDEAEYAGRQISYIAHQYDVKHLSQSCLSNPTKFIASERDRNLVSDVAANLDILYLRRKQIDITEMKKYFNFMLEKGVEIFLLDHILLVEGSQEERLKVAEIANFMKTFAAENNVISIGVSQMNRGTDLTNPTVNDLSGGRSLEHAATALVSIGLPTPKKSSNGMLDMVNGVEVSQFDNSLRKLTLVKSRNSRSGTYLYADFDGDNCIFKPKTPDNWDELMDRGFNYDFDWSEIEC